MPKSGRRRDVPLLQNETRQATPRPEKKKSCSLQGSQRVCTPHLSLQLYVLLAFYVIGDRSRCSWTGRLASERLETPYKKATKMEKKKKVSNAPSFSGCLYCSFSALDGV